MYIGWNSLFNLLFPYLRAPTSSPNSLGKSRKRDSNQEMVLETKHVNILKSQGLAKCSDMFCHLVLKFLTIYNGNINIFKSTAPNI